MAKNSLGLGAEGQAAAGQLGVKERLLPHPVPCQHQPRPGLVPDGQGEHAVEPADEIDSLFLVQVNQAFGVGNGLVNMPLASSSGRISSSLYSSPLYVTQTVPSSLPIGWAPPATSMIDSRRCPSATGPAT